MVGRALVSVMVPVRFSLRLAPVLKLMVSPFTAEAFASVMAARSVVQVGLGAAVRSQVPVESPSVVTVKVTGPTAVCARALVGVRNRRAIPKERRKRELRRIPRERKEGEAGPFSMIPPRIKFIARKLSQTPVPRASRRSRVPKVFGVADFVLGRGLRMTDGPNSAAGA